MQQIEGYANAETFLRQPMLRVIAFPLLHKSSHTAKLSKLKAGNEKGKWLLIPKYCSTTHPPKAITVNNGSVATNNCYGGVKSLYL